MFGLNFKKSLWISFQGPHLEAIMKKGRGYLSFKKNFFFFFWFWKLCRPCTFPVSDLLRQEKSKEKEINKDITSMIRYLIQRKEYGMRTGQSDDDDLLGMLAIFPRKRRGKD